ncbi:MAG: class II aldolase/adducin family protein [Candidatus Hodarchaeales archaeon]
MTSLQELKEDLCRNMKELYAEKILTDIGGNLSIRSPEDETMWISPSGMKKDQVEPEHLVHVSMDGEILTDKTGRGPSIEYPMHLAIYKEDEDFKAIVHSHPPLATAYSILKNPPEIPLLTAELTMLVPEIVIVPYQRSGSQELATAAAEALFDCDIVILENHGVISATGTIQEAAVKTRALEECLGLYLNAKKFGGEIREFPDFLR